MQTVCQKENKIVLSLNDQKKAVKIECNPYKNSMPFCLRTVGGYNTNTTLTLNLRQKNSFLYGLPSIYAKMPYIRMYVCINPPRPAGSKASGPV